MRNQVVKSLLLTAAALSLASCGINSVPTAEENAKAKWADVQAAYQRRANLIPNLEATVKGAAASEKAILTDVVNARAKEELVPLHASAEGDSDVVARLQSGVMGQVRRCAGGWCRIAGSGFDGWVPQERLWGVYPDEKVE